MSEHKKDKDDIAYRYSMPLWWILDKLEEGKDKDIKSFDILNARHELDILTNGWQRIEESNN